MKYVYLPVLNSSQILDILVEQMNCVSPHTDELWVFVLAVWKTLIYSLPGLWSCRRSRHGLSAIGRKCKRYFLEPSRQSLQQGFGIIIPVMLEVDLSTVLGSQH